MTRSSTSSFLPVLLLFGLACFLGACAASLGPGYLVDKQEIQISFAPQPEPHIHVVAEYHLRNTGIRELDSLDVRLPGRRFRASDLTVLWNGAELPQSTSAGNPRDTLLSFPRPWAIGESRTIQFTYDLHSTTLLQADSGFSQDAFALPAEGWTPTLPQARGVFGFGGVPPRKWELVVRVPGEFLVHASGGKQKRSTKNGETEFRFEQTAEDLNPFVVAGRYRETRKSLSANQNFQIWSRADLSAGQLEQVAQSLSKTLSIYDSLFGARGKSNPPLWIVECPQAAGCIPQRTTAYSALLYGTDSEGSAEMISRDTVLFDPATALARPEALAGPALAAGWLGYGQNPGFYEQQPPVSALPAFAAALALEVSNGPQAREPIIRRSLAQIPAHASRESNDDPEVSRAKSLLLFYALRDRVGPSVFQKAIQHMLYARRQRGFDITDLISALEEESHQSIGPFARQWIKRPGVPDEFRARYSESSARQDTFRSGGYKVKDIVLTDKGPKPIGPYSQAVKSNGFLFASGQVSLDPRSNEFVPGDIRQQTERVMENMKGILEASGSNLHHVVKTTVFLKDLNDFAAMNEVYGKYFTAAPPARSTVQVARLPKDALIEIELIAAL